MPCSHAPPPGAFRLTALDIGQGTSVVVETAHHTLLFDAGPGPESTHAGERIVVPYLFAHGLSTLDTLIISHADSDHSGGAPAVLESIGCGRWWRRCAARTLWTDGAGSRRRAALRRGAALAVGRRDVRRAVAASRAARGQTERQSCVLKVTSAAGRSALLAADIEADVERELLQLGT